jgi:hypothetical protein
MKKKIFLAICCLFFLVVVNAQADYWQQRIKYVMDVNLDVNTYRINGKQIITYTNNSPDTLHQIFIHLFWNAFKRNSMMDVNSRSTEGLVLGRSSDGLDITDFDHRFKKRIIDLTPEEQGSCNVLKFTFNGKQQQISIHETILEVHLDKSILPRTTVVFNTEFECKVPKLTRRSGRESPEGIAYSMGQWYPKVAEYDYMGWHADQYIRGEFYGVWGDYDVSITLDKKYKLGATGELQNASAIGWGFDREGTPLKTIAGNLRTWKFSAKNVHDFVWAADPDYKHVTRKIPNGPLLHFIYKDDKNIDGGWQATADTCATIYPFMAKTFGPYPYPVYSFLHGGGGGTEYPMATLIKNYSLETAIHEWCHSWYQMMLATNENLYAWMDEGFADYAEARVLAWLRHKDFFASAEEYRLYFNLAKSPYDEPMSTPANDFNTNLAYNYNSYYKGAVFLRQLGYVVGEQPIDKILLDYYWKWRFKHPTPDDFVHVAEKTSGLQLKWYKDYMVNTTKTVDYSIDSLWEENKKTKIRLRRIGLMPMPIDLQLIFKDGTKELHYIPLDLMYGEKPKENDAISRKEYIPWPWVNMTYIVETDRKLTDITIAEIDPSQRLADIDRRNNKLELKW